MCEIRGFEHCPCGETQRPKTLSPLEQFAGADRQCVVTPALKCHLREWKLRQWETVDEWGLQKSVWVCERECLSLWIRPHTESSFVSSSCYLCVKRHFSIVFPQEDSGQKQSFLPFPHIDIAQNNKRRNKNTHIQSPRTHTQRQTHVRTHINMHTYASIPPHTQLSVVLANSMGNNHALC